MHTVELKIFLGEIAARLKIHDCDFAEKNPHSEKNKNFRDKNKIAARYVVMSSKIQILGQSVGSF